MSTNAKMGFVGFVRLVPVYNGSVYANNIIPDAGIAVRVSSADLKLTQDISYPDVVDNKIDQTLYQLGPAQVGGSIAFPLVHEGTNVGNLYGKENCSTSDTSLASKLWALAAQRDDVGRMKNAFDCQIRYADNLAYQYYGCMVNQMTWTINQSEPVNVTADLIGGAASPNNTPTATGVETLRSQYAPQGANDLLSMLAPARIVTWNDAVMSFWQEDADVPDFLTATEIRQFTCTINNNIERFYTLNGKLAPQDIAAKKREISGSLVIMGHNFRLSQWTEGNEGRFTAPSGIGFGYKLGNSNPNQAYWATGLYGVVFEIEEVSLGTGLFETRTKWRALGDCEQGYLATKMGAANVTTPLTRTSDYGTSTAASYPVFRPSNL